ncbi:MAG TPA: hypothetical protein PLO67_09755 [Saprospiraceae bacterium]|nr:hypothetical protein [Saprospiraceae bacterium]
MKRCLCLPIWLFFLSGLAGLQARTMQTPEKDTIAPSVKPSDWDVAVEALQLSKDAQFIRDSFSRQVVRLSNERGVVERALQLAEADSTSSVEQLKTLRAGLKTAKKDENDAEKNLKRAKTTAEFAESVANMEERQQRQQLPKSRKQVLQLKNIFSPPPPAPEKEKPEKEEKQEPPAEPVLTETPAKTDSTATTSVPATEPEKRRVKTKPAAEPKPLVRTYSAAEDVMITPPALPCTLAYSIRDEFSGEVRREMPQKELFRYTNQALRKVYTMEKPHTIAEASLLSSGLNAALHLTFRISDPNVRRTQGSLQKGGTATLKFMDGNSIILYDSRSDEGVTDPEGKTILFQAQFPIDRATIKKLRTTELDRIRLAWTNGYEDYDVQQVDLLMWQAKCLFEQ